MFWADARCPRTTTRPGSRGGRAPVGERPGRGLARGTQVRGSSRIRCEASGDRSRCGKRASAAAPPGLGACYAGRAREGNGARGIRLGASGVLGARSCTSFLLRCSAYRASFWSVARKSRKRADFLPARRAWRRRVGGRKQAAAVARPGRRAFSRSGIRLPSPSRRSPWEWVTRSARMVAMDRQVARSAERPRCTAYAIPY